MSLVPRTPVLVGYGQANQHTENPDTEPIDLMVAAARDAVPYLAKLRRDTYASWR